MHPTIGVDTPLTFDIIDTWYSRSIGGCTYHVSHPGGRHYSTFPVNAYEAESRRGNRFEDTSYTQDVIQPRAYISEIKHYVEANTKSVPYDPPPIEVSGEYPNTLDMRQFWKKKK